MDENKHELETTDDRYYRRRMNRRERIQIRRERRAENGSHFGGALAGGAVLVGLGVLLLFQNFSSVTIDRYWALLILIPAVGAFISAWAAFRRAGNRLTAWARGSLFTGIILSLLTIIIFFDLDWQLFGPVLLILAGVGLAFNAFLPGEQRENQ